MKVDMDAKKIQRRVMLQFFGDGLWDINIGITFLIIGLGILFDVLYLAGIWVVLGSTWVVQAKAHYTYPRLGYVKFKNTSKRIRMGVVSGLILLVLVISMLLLANKPSFLVHWIRVNFNYVLAIVLGGGLLAIAILQNISRIYFYSIGLILAMVLVDRVGSIGINLIIVGTLIALMGVLLLIRFVRKYPIQKIER